MMSKKYIICILALFVTLTMSVGTVFVWPSPKPALNGEVNIKPLSPTKETENFKWLLEETIDPIKERLDNTNIGSIRYGWADAIVIFVIDLFKTYVFPLVIILATLTAIFWFLEIMMSSDEKKRKSGINYFLWWIVGIIIFVGAEFIFNNLYGIINEIAWASSGWAAWPSRNVYAWKIFNQIIYPFLKLAMYLIMGWLFLIVIIKAVEYMTNPSEKINEQAKDIMISAATGIIVILLAKTLVQAVYSNEKNVLSDSNGSIFVWWAILDTNSQDYTPVFTVINYFLGIIAFIMLCIIIYQWYLMLFEWNTEEGTKKMRKNLLYMFGGLALIWLSYLIVNVLIIN